MMGKKALVSNFFFLLKKVLITKNKTVFFDLEVLITF